MSFINGFISSFDFPLLPERKGTAAGVLVEPIPGCDERFCVAVICSMDDGQRGAAVTLNPRITKNLMSGDLAHSLSNLANICCQDFKQSEEHFKNHEDWYPPFNGISLTKWREFGADEIHSLLEQAKLIFSTLSHSGNPKDPPTEEYIAPKVSEEDNFKRAVRNAVLTEAPELERFFDNRISAAFGGSQGFYVDYLSSSLSACFSTINPKTSRKSALKRHHETLWRIARSRDFGLFKPFVAELIVWCPEPGMPLFTPNEYEIASDIMLELTYEARKEDIGVISQYREGAAATHVIKREKEIALST